eukprot:15482508-Alexandrium_andersonii.AAC.1
MILNVARLVHTDTRSGACPSSRMARPEPQSGKQPRAVKKHLRQRGETPPRLRPHIQRRCDDFRHGHLASPKDTCTTSPAGRRAWKDPQQTHHGNASHERG